MADSGRWAEIVLRRVAGGAVERLVYFDGRHYRDGLPCPAFDFWAEHDAAYEILGLRLRLNPPGDGEE